jgi:FkbM family methyltransferase
MTASGTPWIRCATSRFWINFGTAAPPGISGTQSRLPDLTYRSKTLSTKPLTLRRIWNAFDRRRRIAAAYIDAALRRACDRRGGGVAEARYIDRRYLPFSGRGCFRVTFLGKPLLTPWLPMLRVQLRAFFVLDEYLFDLPPDPVIVDAGANLGVSTLYFAHQYRPRALVAIEADPDMYRDYLVPNMQAQNVQAELLNKALWKEPGMVHFSLTGVDDGSVTDTGEIGVEAVTLEQLADQYGYLDLVKLSIEGAELEIIPSSRALDRIGNLYILIVVKSGFEKNPEPVLQALTRAGFQYFLRATPADLHASPAAVFARHEGVAYFLHILARRPRA